MSCQVSSQSRKIQKGIKQVVFRVDKNAVQTARILDYGQKTQRFLSHQDRIDILYAFIVQKVTIQQIALSMDRSYYSIKSIIAAYRKYGHTNRLRNFQQKGYLLSVRSNQRNQFLNTKSNIGILIYDDNDENDDNSEDQPMKM